MLRRLALPIGVVLLLGAIAVVSLQLGYLGRKTGGPLEEPSGISVSFELPSAKRWAVAGLTYRVRDDGRVRVSGATAVLKSPGLRVRGPRIGARAAAYNPRRFPGRTDQGPVVGRRLRGTGVMALGMKARSPGIYVLWRFDLEYEQGARSYRRVLDDPVCVAVRSACPNPPLERPDPGEHPLADLGGPSDYGATPRDPEFAAEPLRVPVPGRPGTRTITTTLTNQTDDAIEVRGLRLAPVTFNGFTLRSAEVPAFRLAPRAGRAVTLELQGTGCNQDRGGTSSSGFRDRLTAVVDGERRAVPLLVAFDGVAVSRC